MTYEFNILLGKILKLAGFEGAVILKLEKSFIENIPELESVFLEIEGRVVPFFISYSEYSGADTLKVKFAGYNSPEKVKEFTGCNVYLSTTGKIVHKDDDHHEFIGYKVFSSDNKLLGLIREIILNQEQWLLNIHSTTETEILIPFHEHFIVKIDTRNKTIIMDLPEGLTDINL